MQKKLFEQVNNSNNNNNNKLNKKYNNIIYKVPYSRSFRVLRGRLGHRNSTFRALTAHLTPKQGIYLTPEAVERLENQHHDF